MNLADPARIGDPTVLEPDVSTRHSVWMIDAGARLYVVGDVRALEAPTDGATHGRAIEPGEEIRVSLLSLQEQVG
ncbi:MAG: hypothetical protein ABI821_18580 [Pseudomonadota bacterium]